MGDLSSELSGQATRPGSGVRGLQKKDCRGEEIADPYLDLFKEEGAWEHQAAEVAPLGALDPIWG